MRRHNWVLALAIAAMLACTPELTQREIFIERERVQQRLEQFTRVMNNGWVDSVLAMYQEAPNVRVHWMDGTRSSGWEEVKSAWEAFYESTDYLNFVTQDVSVEILSPTIALCTFGHSTDIVRGGKRLPVTSGPGTILWMKDEADGLWKIHLSQIGAAQPMQN